MKDLVTILGPTATGKTRLAANLALEINGEIISADSRQVYRNMDIGTGKDISDYTVSETPIPYYLVDIVEPGYEFNLFEFYKEFNNAYKKITSNKKVPILCGGTGLYLDAVIRGYELLDVPENIQLRKQLENATIEELSEKLKEIDSLHNTTDTKDRNRTIRAIEIASYKLLNPKSSNSVPALDSVNFGILFDRKIIRERITERLKTRLNEGMIKEVTDLLEGGLKPDQLTFYGLEYKYVTLYVTGEISYNEMFEKLNTAIHQFAKRQSTWFRRMERKGVRINWIDGNLTLEDKIGEMLKVLKSVS